jgi:hypothetical protein
VPRWTEPVLGAVTWTMILEGRDWDSSVGIVSVLVAG